MQFTTGRKIANIWSFEKRFTLDFFVTELAAFDQAVTNLNLLFIGREAGIVDAG